MPAFQPLVKPAHNMTVTDIEVFRSEDGRTEIGLVRRYKDGSWSASPSGQSTRNFRTRYEAVLFLNLPASYQHNGRKMTAAPAEGAA